MVFAAVNPRERVAGTPFENVAEEVLNGIFCHYEPPVSEYAQHKAANDVRTHPNKYSFSQVKKHQSILRTSRLFRKKQAVEVKKKKAVTWRDEQNRKGIEGRIEACATQNCDFLGLSRKGGNGLADSISPSQKVTSVAKPAAKNPFPEPIIKPTPTSTEPLKSAPPKKILYDDEGNPISADNNQDENMPPITYGRVPPAPTGLSQLREMAKHLDDDIYEPEDYDHPSVHSGSGGKRGQTHHNATPRPTRGDDRSGSSYTFEGQDKITMARSQSPTASATPNHYDTPEQFENKDRQPSVDQRPSTPYRRRRGEGGDVMEADHADKPIGGCHNGRSAPISPSRRSEVFSDLTMDEAISGRNGYRYPTSPAKTSEGVEVDMYKGRARPRSRSPGRYRDDGTPVKDDESSSHDSHVVYDDKGNVLRGKSGKEGSHRQDNSVHEATRLSRKSSRDERRRHTLHDFSQPNANLDATVPRKSSSRSRRTSEPLPPNGQARKSSGEVDGFRESRKISSKSSAAVPIIDTIHDSEEEEAAYRQRDPTPRMSLEPTTGESTNLEQGPLPPTPRRKDTEGPSPLEARQDEHRHRGRGGDYPRGGRETRNQERTLPPTNESSQMLDGQAGGANMYDWAYNALMKQFSPKSAATDDEIRAEVTSVGMESNTLRPIPYPKPFFNKPKPPPIQEERVIYEEKTPDLRPVSSDDAGSEPSSISNSTISSHERQPVKKAKSADVVRNDLSVHKSVKKAKSADLPRDTSAWCKKNHSKKQRKDHHQHHHRHHHHEQRDARVIHQSSSGSTRTKKLWKGWRKAVGKVKAIVKDIDEQRIPPPMVSGYQYRNPHLQSQHPTLGAGAQPPTRRKVPSS